MYDYVWIQYLLSQYAHYEVYMKCSKFKCSGVSQEHRSAIFNKKKQRVQNEP